MSLTNQFLNWVVVVQISGDFSLHEWIKIHLEPIGLKL